MGTPGGIHPVDISPEINNLAHFSVHEHNKKYVLSAKEHVVGGFSYYITLETADGEKNKVYKAQEFVKDWENVKEVQKFKLVGDLYQIYGTGRNMMQS